MFGFGKGKKYSAKWFKKASESELKREREKVRRAYCNSYNDGLSDSEASRLYDLLSVFDEELAKKWDSSEWENNPKRNRDPNYRWTDKNRWEKD